VSEIEKLILAVPTGRILKQLFPIFQQMGIEPEAALQNKSSGKHQFITNIPDLDIILVKPFDVPTWVSLGAAQLGVAGSDALMEYNYAQPQRIAPTDIVGFDSESMYTDIDLGIGRCRLSLAQPDHLPVAVLSGESRVRVATKYPNTARHYFNARGLSLTHIALTGAMELAPGLGMSDYIFDIVDTGKTLDANGLKVIEDVAMVTSRLIVNRIATKTMPEKISYWIDKFRAAVEPVDLSELLAKRRQPRRSESVYTGR
jgi:ATP phosphoribosyltransferase